MAMRLKDLPHGTNIEKVEHDGRVFYFKPPNGHALDIIMPQLVRMGDGSRTDSAPATLWACFICGGLCSKDGALVYDIANKDDINEVLNEDTIMLKELGNAAAKIANLAFEDDEDDDNDGSADAEKPS